MKNKKTVISCCLFVCCIMLHGCGQSKAPNETDIRDAVVKYNMTEFSREAISSFNGKTIVMSNIDSVQINRQQTESKENNTYCTIEMSNDSCRVVMDCSFNFSYYDDKKWYPEGRDIERYVFYPLSGVNEEQSYDETVENLHAEPESIDTFWRSYTHDSVYRLQLIEHETDLDNSTDKLTYDYSKSSDFCTESGLVLTYYTFDSNNGSWVYDDMSDDGLSYEYNPEGQWRFDIYTHYYRINISDVDYTNNTAVIYYKDSSWQGEADSGELTDSERISFTITDEGMSFSPFNNHVYLLLKKDTMYVSDDGSRYAAVEWPRYVE